MGTVIILSEMRTRTGITMLIRTAEEIVVPDVSALWGVAWHGAEESGPICWCTLARGELLRLNDGLVGEGSDDGAE